MNRLEDAVDYVRASKVDTNEILGKPIRPKGVWYVLYG